MSHSIPVFFCPVDESELPDSLSAWGDAEELLARRLDDRHRYGLRESTFRNWWQLDALTQISQGLGVQGLEFIRSEVACLDSAQLLVVAQALDHILTAISNGIPDLGDAEVEYGAVWWLRHYQRDGELGQTSQQELAEAFEKAQPLYEVEDYGSSGAYAAESFFSFVKSVRQAVEDAMQQSKWLLFVSPQP